MEVTAANGVKIYNVSAGKATPLWLQEKKKRDKAYVKGLGAFLRSSVPSNCSFPPLLFFCRRRIRYWHHSCPWNL